MQQDKIELLLCNSGSQNCKEHLLIINKCYIDATSFRLEKDYLNSIESLKMAFVSTTKLNEASCLKCAELFRSTITESLENINGELHELTSGLIKSKRYQFCYKKSCAILDDIKTKIWATNLDLKS